MCKCDIEPGATARRHSSLLLVRPQGTPGGLDGGDERAFRNAEVVARATRTLRRSHACSSSRQYAAAVNETRSLGGAASAARTAEQHEVARFHTEPPPPAITRNLGRFASSTANVGDAARLMATIYVSYVDAIGACFEAKYHYGTWRPVSAIQMAVTSGSDGNAATAPDAAWAPALPTPNHPEYPAAHSCTSGSVGEALRNFYGTPNVTFTWDSTVTKTTRTYNSIDAFNAEAGMARIHGGMHFRHATAAGEDLGRRVAQWVTQRHFGRQD